MDAAIVFQIGFRFVPLAAQKRRFGGSDFVFTPRKAVAVVNDQDFHGRGENRPLAFVHAIQKAETEPGAQATGRGHDRFE